MQIGVVVSQTLLSDSDHFVKFSCPVRVPDMQFDYQGTAWVYWVHSGEMSRSYIYVVDGLVGHFIPMQLGKKHLAH